MSEYAYLGEVEMFAFSFVPEGSYACNGQIISINENTALFSLLGTTYGGDGMSTFALPDLRGRIPVGQGSGPGLNSRYIGQSSGVESVTLTIANLPAHSHALNANAASSVASPINNYSGGGLSGYSNATNGIMNGAAVGTAGGTQPHFNVQPYLAINYCIANQGVYPSRN